MPLDTSAMLFVLQPLVIMARGIRLLTDFRGVPCQAAIELCALGGQILPLESTTAERMERDILGSGHDSTSQFRLSSSTHEAAVCIAITPSISLAPLYQFEMVPRALWPSAAHLRVSVS